jgi:hypothetical protein
MPPLANCCGNQVSCERNVRHTKDQETAGFSLTLASAIPISTKESRGSAKTRGGISQNPRHLRLLVLQLLADVNADCHVATGVLAVRDVGIGSDLQLAVYGRVLVDLESHALLTTAFLHQMLTLV